MCRLLLFLLFVTAIFAFQLRPGAVPVQHQLRERLTSFSTSSYRYPGFTLDNRGTKLCSTAPSEINVIAHSSTDASPPKFTLNLANQLTISRICAIPFFMFAVVMRKKSLAVLIYVLSCVTDFVDGYVARKYNQMSAFGAFLDPVADKLMVATALIMLVCQIPTWWFACPVAIIMCREIGVSALREWMAERGERGLVQVGSLGKIKTVFQMISTAILLEACPGASDFDIALSLGMSRTSFFTVGLFLLYVSTMLTVVSGMQYLKAAWPSLTAQKNLKN